MYDYIEIKYLHMNNLTIRNILKIIKENNFKSNIIFKVSNLQFKKKGWTIDKFGVYIRDNSLTDESYWGQFRKYSINELEQTQLLDKQVANISIKIEDYKTITVILWVQDDEIEYKSNLNNYKLEQATKTIKECEFLIKLLKGI